MMLNEIETLMGEYTRWLKDKTVVNQVDKEWVEITTPHLDRHNDYLQFYIRKEEGNYLLTDDGYIINDLVSSGCALDSPKRQQLLQTTLNGFGVLLKDEQLYLQATRDNFALKKHNLVQAMLAVNDLFYLASPYVSSFFYEDVAKWLDLANIRYTEKIKFTGKSGYDHLFDFIIPKSKQQPERIIQAVNNPKKDAVEAMVFKWLDTRKIRQADVQLHVFLNNAKSAVSSGVIAAFENYDINSVPWSQREEVKDKLAA